MLNLLIDYATTHGLTIEPGFKPKTVRWAIVCNQHGHYQHVQPIGSAESGMVFQRVPHLEQPEIKRGGHGCRHFLVDTSEVVARYTGGSTPSESSDKHHFFLSLLKQAASGLPILGYIASAMQDEATIRSIVQQLSEQNAKKDDKITFAVMTEGISFPVNATSWHPWWREFRTRLIEQSEHTLICLASGCLGRPAMTHPVVSGLNKYGGQSSGDRMSSYKQDAFQSYNLYQSQNAAVSDHAAWAYRAALDDLIADWSQDLAGASVVHWYAGDVKVEKQEDPMGLLDESLDLSWLEDASDDGNAERDALHRARVFLRALKSGSQPRLKELERYRYYAMILSANSGRVVARDWSEGQFGELAESIVDWFQALEVTNISGSHSAHSPKIDRVITCLLPPIKPGQKYRDWIKPVGGERVQLWRAAISQDVPLPHKVLSRLVPLHQAFMLSGDFTDAVDERSHTRGKNLSLLYARMGLLKAYHIRKGDKDMQAYLNEEHPNPAYHCGRVMAVLAEIQQTALGNVGANVVQRYYAAASTTPALVLGRLVRTSNYHFEKIGYHRKKSGLKDLIAGIWCPLKDVVPCVLTMEDQSYFALGYYQQLAQLATIDWATYKHRFTTVTDKEGEQA